MDAGCYLSLLLDCTGLFKAPAWMTTATGPSDAGNARHGGAMNLHNSQRKIKWLKKEKKKNVVGLELLRMDEKIACPRLNFYAHWKDWVWMARLIALDE